MFDEGRCSLLYSVRTICNCGCMIPVSGVVRGGVAGPPDSAGDPVAAADRILSSPDGGPPPGIQLGCLARRLVHGRRGSSLLRRARVAREGNDGDGDLGVFEDVVDAVSEEGAIGEGTV